MKSKMGHTEKKEDPGRKDKHFFIISGCLIIFVTILLLVCYTLYMGRQIEYTTENVNNIYMTEINLQLQQKFKSVMEVRFAQVDRMMDQIASVKYDDDNFDDILEQEGVLRNFSFVGFLDNDYELSTIYGGDYTIEGGNDIKTSIAYDGNVLEYVTNENGEKYLMFGRSTTDFVLENGKPSTAFVVGIEMSRMENALFLDSDQGNVYTHVINSNGDFIITNGFIEGNNYFNGLLQSEVEDLQEVRNCISEFQNAIKSGEQYNFQYSLNGEKYYVCCSTFSDNSQWYYVTVMRGDLFESHFDRLNNVRFAALIVVLFILVFMMLVMFYIYYKMNQKQLRELDEAKKNAEKESSAKTEFLSNMSHDIRTPMNAVIGMTDIALKYVDNPERIRYCLEKVVTASKHLLSMINDILDVSKIESGKMELSIRENSLKSTVDDLVALSQSMIKEKGQMFDVFIHQIKAEEVYCDDIRLYQILVNILSNAFKYTREGGKIFFEIYQEASDQGEDYIKTIFKISDNGIGMTPEFVDKIFEKFERADDQIVHNITGTGLGMSISKHLTDLMGGELKVESVLHEGSTFELSVDFKIAGEFEMDQKLPNWDILVVDDDELLCKTAAISLEELGVNPEWMTESRKAVERIEQRREEGKEFDFVLLDWNMPDMDGVETIKRIRSAGSVNLPIFLISAYDLSDVEEKINLTEFEGFIAKPLFKSRLYQTLGKYAGHSSVQNALSKETKSTFADRRILVAEDIDINWEIVKEALDSEGIWADNAENGKVCVEKFCDSPEGYYDLILMDIRMPVMNGMEATKEIRKLNRKDKNLPIIAMTANAFSEDVQQCLDCGMNGHIAKPIELKNFLTVLYRFLEH